MAKLNFLFSFLYTMNAIGLILTIIGLIVIVLINEPLTNIVYRAPLKWFTGVQITDEEKLNNKMEEKKVKEDKKYYINDDVTNIVSVYNGLNNNIIYGENSGEKSGETINQGEVYGPSKLMAYWSILFFVYAAMFIMMGLIYIACEYEAYELAKEISKCAKINIDHIKQ